MKDHYNYLEMSTAGQHIDDWLGASTTYAQAAVNSGQKIAHVFIDEAGYRGVKSIRASIEKPIIEEIMKIIVHFV